MGREELYRKMTEERRESILKAARHYFVQNGITSTAKMSDIARAAGVSRQTLYQHFKNLDDVVYGVAEYVMTQGYFDISAYKKEAIAPLDVVRETIRALFETYSISPENAIFIIFFDIYNYTSRETQSHQRAYQDTIAAFPGLFKVIETGIQDGSIRKDIDPQLAQLVLTNTIGGAWQRLVIIDAKGDPSDTIQNKKLIDEIVDMAIRYLEPR